MAKLSVWVVLAVDQDGDPSVSVWESRALADEQARYLNLNGCYPVVEVAERSIDTAADLPTAEDFENA